MRAESILKPPSPQPFSSQGQLQTSPAKQRRRMGAVVSSYHLISAALPWSHAAPAPAGVPPMGCCPSQTDHAWAFHRLQLFKNCPEHLLPSFSTDRGVCTAVSCSLSYSAVPSCCCTVALFPLNLLSQGHTQRCLLAQLWPVVCPFRSWL